MSHTNLKTLNNMFTKQNYAYLCQDRRYEDPSKKDKKDYLHIPDIKPPICENMHRELEIQNPNKFYRKKQALFHQTMVSHRQLDSILKEIGDKETQKKEAPGVILNLNRKKIFDIINIYTEVLKFKVNSEEKKIINEESVKSIKQEKIIKEEMKEIRKVNHRLVEMISHNQKKLYGKEKMNQDKAKFLFENSSFFMDLVSSFSRKKTKSTHKIPYEKTKNEISMIKTSDKLNNEIKINEKNNRKSISLHIPMGKLELDEKEKVLKEIDVLKENLPQIKIDEKSGEPNFNEIKSKNILSFDEFHQNSVLNSIFFHKEERVNKKSPIIPLKKRAQSVSQRLDKLETDHKKEKIMINEKPIEELNQIKDFLTKEKQENSKIRKMLRKKKKTLFFSLNKMNKKLMHIS